MAGRDAPGAELLPQEIFRDPVLRALLTTHRGLGRELGAAVRYRAEVAPFAAVREPSAGAMRDLAGLLEAGESVWMFGDALPATAELRRAETLPCVQMVLPELVVLPAELAGVERLGEADAAEMVALTDVAFPGFFRTSTVEMGRYFGVRDDAGRLVAMGGERLRFPGYSEISGLCTHPEARGRGYAAGLIGRLARLHRQECVVSWLHVGAANARAVALYEWLGFVRSRTLELHRMERLGVLRGGGGY